MNIIHYTSFKPNPWGNGAEKRTSQIIFRLENMDVSYTPFSSLNKKHRIPRYKYYREGYSYLKRHDYPLISRSHIALTGYEICNMSMNLEEFEGPKVLIWESSRYSNNLIPYIAKKSNTKLIALPHNLESLVPTQSSMVTEQEGIEYFKEELKLLNYCDEIFTISQEEHWLLDLLGFNVHYLPYYPVPEIKDYLLEIRQKRKEQGVQDYFLLLGTVLNPPTKQGFISLISYISESVDHIKLKVAGYATESIVDGLDFDRNKIEILGSVENDHLKDLLSNCKALIINQLPSSGALTKVQEMLIAGIPIIGNSLSFRSYYNLNGVYPFIDFTAFAEILGMEEFEIPEIPEREIKTENRFGEIIHSYLSIGS